MSESSRRGVRSIFDPESFRKKREDDTISIRKQKREEQNLKRRMLMASSGAAGDATTPAQMASQPLAAPVVTPGATPGAAATTQPVLAKMPVPGSDRFTNPAELLQALQSPDVTLHLQAATHIRRILSIEKSPPIDAVINAGCLPYLVQCLGADDNPKLQFEAAWALTNVASGESRHTNELVKCGAVQPLLRLLGSPSWEIREQAVWALGNVAGDGATLRDYLLNMGAMQALIAMLQQLLREAVPMSLIRNTAWTLSNMYRGKPSPPLQLVAPGLPMLKLLLNHPDDEVVVDTIWAVSYATECNVIDKPTPSTQMPTVDERIDAVNAAGILPDIYRFLSAPELSKALPSVRTFGNILTGSAKYTDLVLQMNILPPFLQVLTRKNRVIRKEVLWALSNVAAGTAQHVQALIDASVIITANQVIETAEFELQKEAGWLIANASVCATPEQVRLMVDSHKLLESLAAILKLPDTALLKMALSSLEAVLNVGETCSESSTDQNPYVVKLEELNVDETLNKLQMHKSKKIYEASYDILRDYFETDDQPDGMDDTLGDDASATAAGTGGAAAPAPGTNPALNFGPAPQTGSAMPQFSFSTQGFVQPGQGTFFQ